MRIHRRGKGERRSFAERDYAELLSAAHQQLGGPIVLIWDPGDKIPAAVGSRLGDGWIRPVSANPSADLSMSSFSCRR
jgi:hypothetical protein